LKSEIKNQPDDVLVKDYSEGRETEIVDFLNLCFGAWGDLEKWRYAYSQYPSFSNEDIVIMEKGGKIVGHGGIHLRDLVLKNKGRVPAALLGDAAVHPNCRGKGIYSRIVELRLDRARSRGASFAFWWAFKNSIPYKTGLKCGFIEVKQSPLFMKILKPEKVLKAGLSDLLYKNRKLRDTLRQLEVDICFRIKGEEVHLKDLLNEVFKREEYIQISLSEKAFSSLANFRNMSSLKRIATLLFLVGSRGIKVKASSLSTFLKLVTKGKDIARAL
jgi:N-acetylglutamate synthase-like GNAT family acetyltransferase